MGRNLIRRIRWGNLALAAAGTAAIVFGVLWAFSATTPPVLPGDEPRPLLAQEPIPTLSAPTPTPPKKSEESEKEQRVKPRAPRRVRRGGKQSGREKRAETARGRRTTPAAPTAAATPAPTVPPVRVAPRRSAPAPQPRGEFGFEG
ncbi:hypothetical protein OJ998_16600 [Solirubrobacter taibaiensis]|nr:hypothetical protein [Solirubrobacter taibaiensis]